MTKYHRLSGLNIEIYCLTLTEVIKIFVRFWVDSVRGIEQKSVPCLSLGFWWFDDNIWPFLDDVCLHVHMVFFLYVCPCPNYLL